MLAVDPFKPRWADVFDSSQEDIREDSRAASRSLVEDSSYGGDDSTSGLASLREEFSRCARTGCSSSSKEPVDFSFLLDESEPLPQLQEEPAGSQAATPASCANRSGASGGVSGSKRSSRRKRRGGGPAEAQQTMSPQKRAKAVQASADGAEEASQAPHHEGGEDWKHRVEKRGRAVDMIKATPDYRAYSKARPAGERLQGEPRTPEATDRTVSKRRWEQEVQQWRAGLRQWCCAQDVGTQEAIPVAASAADPPGERPDRRQPSVLELLKSQGRR